MGCNFFMLHPGLRRSESGTFRIKSVLRLNDSHWHVSLWNRGKACHFFFFLYFNIQLFLVIKIISHLLGKYIALECVFTVIYRLNPHILLCYNFKIKRWELIGDYLLGEWHPYRWTVGYMPGLLSGRAHD